MKRAFDLVVGTALAVVATPVILLLAVISGAYLGAWPFFTQTRIGQHGKPFTFIKIRTLPTHTPKYTLKKALEDIPRPHFLEFMRQRHLDELPQLWLVPLGKMSLVGPRPKMPDEFEPVEANYRAARQLVPQGCTCLWQVGLATDMLPSDSPEYDYFYVENSSLSLDIWILWRTALKFAGFGRPVGIGDIPAWVGRAWSRSPALERATSEAASRVGTL